MHVTLNKQTNKQINETSNAVEVPRKCDKINICAIFFVCMPSFCNKTAVCSLHVALNTALKNFHHNSANQELRSPLPTAHWDYHQTIHQGQDQYHLHYHHLLLRRTPPSSSPPPRDAKSGRYICAIVSGLVLIFEFAQVLSDWCLQYYHHQRYQH